jgi:hypothetical protein
VSGFVLNQVLDNDEMPTEYNLFAAICHKVSRNKTSGLFTAQCKIKGSNGYWIEYNNAHFELNNFINSRNRTRAKVKYHPLAHFLFYIRRDPAVSPENGLQVQENDGVSQLHAENHDDEQNHGDLVTNEQQDMSVREDINQVDGTARQTTVIDIDDSLSTDDDNLLTCTFCLQKINSISDRGYDTEGQCQCLHDYHYDCLSEMNNDCRRRKTNMRCCQCRQQIFGILDCERVNRYATIGDTANCPICQCRLNTHNELGRMITGPPTNNGCQCTAKHHYSCLLHYKNDQQSQNPTQDRVRCVMCRCISEGIRRI